MSKAPTDSAESALIASLTPGSYTTIVRGANSGTGIGLAEVYDLEQSSPALMSNLSPRGFVQSGADVMMGDFIVGGTQASSIVTRALGPSLTQSGVSTALVDPVLELHDANGALIGFNDNWTDTQQSVIQAAGLSPGDPRKAVIESTLAPGGYTAIVSGRDGGAGIGLVEVYKLP
ncbi:MAG: hypothetical protein ABIS03_13535 [Gemmatimonadaceae bacterium]